jgi:hypothetical protein
MAELKCNEVTSVLSNRIGWLNSWRHVSFEKE